MTFLNVDLQIRTAADPASLAAEIAGKARVLYCGPFHEGHLINIESHQDPANVDETINDLCGIVESLSPTSRDLWKSAFRREFDAGFEATPTHEAFVAGISSCTLRRMASLDVSFAVTIYPPPPEQTKAHEERS